MFDEERASRHAYDSSGSRTATFISECSGREFEYTLHDLVVARVSRINMAFACTQVALLSPSSAHHQRSETVGAGHRRCYTMLRIDGDGIAHSWHLT